MNIHDHKGIQSLLEKLGLLVPMGRFVARHNVAPGAEIFAAFAQGNYDLANMEWGIVPPWAKPGKFKRPLINARAETVWEKPSFRSLIKSKRAIVPVNGFYEWQRSGKTKITYYIHPRQGDALALAALYQTSKEGVMQCCVITTSANATMEPVHNRMPVILNAEDMQNWLTADDADQLNELLKPAADDVLRLSKVSDYVNNARNEGAECIQPLEATKNK
ncbi:SOS response-associated peptidase [Pseudomonadota bacterium]